MPARCVSISAASAETDRPSGCWLSTRSTRRPRSSVSEWFADEAVRSGVLLT